MSIRVTQSKGLPTVSARLYRDLNVADALHGHPVLVVTINELILKLADLINQDTKLVRHIRDIVVGTFAPERQLLLFKRISAFESTCTEISSGAAEVVAIRMIPL